MAGGRAGNAKSGTKANNNKPAPKKQPAPEKLTAQLFPRDDAVTASRKRSLPDSEVPVGKAKKTALPATLHQPNRPAATAAGPLTLQSIEAKMHTELQALVQLLDKHVSAEKAHIDALEAGVHKKAKKDYNTTCEGIKTMGAVLANAQEQHQQAMGEVKACSAELRKAAASAAAGLESAMKIEASIIQDKVQQLKRKSGMKA